MKPDPAVMNAMRQMQHAEDEMNKNIGRAAPNFAQSTMEPEILKCLKELQELGKKQLDAQKKSQKTLDDILKAVKDQTTQTKQATQQLAAEVKRMR